mgnify:CR=1 FL=1
MNRYVSGSNIDVYTNGVKTRENAEEWGRESELTYVVQSGPLKSLGLKWRNSSLRKDWAGSRSFDENRVIINFPLDIL